MASNGFSIGMMGVDLTKVGYKRSVIQQGTFTTKGVSSRYRIVKERYETFVTMFCAAASRSSSMTLRVR
jgi:hypothetical protein